MSKQPPHEGRLDAPWTGEQVDALNRYQRLDQVHEFTCIEPHQGFDRTLYATVKGWRCPHCDYRQDWAHRAMLRVKPLEEMLLLPCDVLLPPATLVHRGASLAVLMAAFKYQAGLSRSQNYFDEVPRHRADWKVW